MNILKLTTAWFHQGFNYRTAHRQFTFGAVAYTFRWSLMQLHLHLDYRTRPFPQPEALGHMCGATPCRAPCLTEILLWHLIFYSQILFLLFSAYFLFLPPQFPAGWCSLRTCLWQSSISMTSHDFRISDTLYVPNTWSLAKMPLFCCP